MTAQFIYESLCDVFVHIVSGEANLNHRHDDRLNQLLTSVVVSMHTPDDLIKTKVRALPQDLREHK